MNLLDLPEELLREILKRLDTNSKLLLWDMCCNHASHIRNLLRHQSVMQRVHLAGDYSVLQQPALLDLAPYIVELDLSGLRTLNLHPVLKVIEHFTNLRDLDLTHTRVGLMDACKLCELCPKLKRLAVSFDWPGASLMQIMMPDEDDGLLHLKVQRCQQAFSRLEDVRFLGDYWAMLKSTHPLEVLRLNDYVHSLRLDVIENMELVQRFQHSQRVPLSLRTFGIHYMDRKLKNDDLLKHKIVRFFNLESWHYLVMEIALVPFFHMSESLYAFSEQFLGNAQSNVISSSTEHKGSHLYMWHSDLERHNPQLLQQITDRIRMHAPTLTCDMNERSNNVNILSKSFVVHVFSLLPASCTRPDSSEPPANLQYNEERDYYLNLDLSLQIMRDARVSVVNENCRKCSLSGDLKTRPVLQLDLSSDTVRNLSFLSITDCWIDASFNALWEICRHLQTLKLIMSSSHGSPPSGFDNVMQTVHLSSSIKNVMYVDVNVDVRKVLRSMAQCPSLENVFWGNMQETRRDNLKEEPDLKDFSQFVGCCRNLRSISLNLHSLKNYKIHLRNALQQHKRHDILLTTQSKYPYDKMERNDPYFTVFEHFDADNIFSDMNLNFE